MRQIIWYEIRDISSHQSIVIYKDTDIKTICKYLDILTNGCEIDLISYAGFFHNDYEMRWESISREDLINVLFKKADVLVKINDIPTYFICSKEEKEIDIYDMQEVY